MENHKNTFWGFKDQSNTQLTFEYQNTSEFYKSLGDLTGEELYLFLARHLFPGNVDWVAMKRVRIDWPREFEGALVNDRIVDILRK